MDSREKTKVEKSPQYRNIGQCLFDKLKNNPEKIGQIDVSSGDNYTYKKMLELSISCALWIKNQNLKKNDKIVICTNRNMDSIVVYIACFFVGNVVSPWFSDENQDAVDRRMKIVEPKLIFSDHSNLDAIAESVKKQNPSAKIVSFEKHSSFESLSEILQRKSSTELDNFRCDDLSQPSETAIIIFTSGTTGNPKAIEFSHNSFLPAMEKMPGMDDNEAVWLWYGKMGWLSETYFALRAIALGATSILHRNFDPEETCAVVEKFKALNGKDTRIFLNIEKFRFPKGIIVLKVTSLSLSTWMLQKFYRLGAFTKYDLSSLKLLSTGSSRVRPKLLQALSRLLPDTLLMQSYATSESGSLFADPKATRDDTNFRSVGRPVRGVSVKIIDSESGSPLGPKEIGEICLKSPFRMKGYYKMPELTEKTFDDEGYFHCGDLGYCDSDGYVYITNRIQDIICRSGKFVDVFAIENLLEDHPFVMEVAVVGMSHKIEGEQPIAFVEKCGNYESTRLSKELIELSATLGAENKLVHVEFVDKIPRNPTSTKMKKNAMREIANNVKI